MPEESLPLQVRSIENFNTVIFTDSDIGSFSGCYNILDAFSKLLSFNSFIENIFGLFLNMIKPFNNNFVLRTINKGVKELISEFFIEIVRRNNFFFVNKLRLSFFFNQIFNLIKLLDSKTRQCMFGIEFQLMKFKISFLGNTCIFIN